MPKVKGQECPKCRRFSVVYNGNYYCSRCPWVMKENRPVHRIIKAYLIQCFQAAPTAYERKRIGSYLEKYADN